MTEQNLTEEEVGDLFAIAQEFPDADEFTRRVKHRLDVKLWLRGWLVAFAGFVGGIYALAQIVHMPGWALSSSRAQLVKAAADTDHTLLAGFKNMGFAGQDTVNFMSSSVHYLSLMQTPLFFWASFSLCLCVLALYYAYSQEEAI